MRSWLILVAAALFLHSNGRYSQVLSETPTTFDTAANLIDWSTSNTNNGLVLYGLDALDSVLYPFSDDHIMGPIQLPIGFSCGCELVQELQVSVDGFVVLGPLVEDAFVPLPSALSSNNLPEEAQVIGPLLTDLRMELWVSAMWYHVYYKYQKGHKYFPSVLDSLYQRTSGTEGFPVMAVVVTWENMRLGGNQTNNTELITFQLILLTDSVTTYGVFNYGDVGGLAAGQFPHPAAIVWQCQDVMFYSNLLSPSEEYSQTITSGTASTIAFSLGSCPFAVSIAINFCHLESHDILCPCLLKLAEVDERFSETEAEGCYIVDMTTDGLVEDEVCCYDQEGIGGFLLQQTVNDFLESPRFDFQVPERVVRASTPPPDTTEKPTSTSISRSSTTALPTSSSAFSSTIKTTESFPSFNNSNFVFLNTSQVLVQNYTTPMSSPITSPIPTVTTATTPTSTINTPISTVTAPTISSISQIPPVTTATPTTSSISQIPPVTTATPTTSSISQIPPVTTATLNTSSISLIPPVTIATPTTSSVSQIPPVTTATSIISSISQIPTVTTATSTISSISQIPTVTTATPTTPSISPIPPVTIATSTISSISQIPPVTTATPTTSSVSQIPPVTTATPTISPVSQIPPVTTATPTTSSVSQIPPVTTATPTTSSISQIPPVTTATPTTSSISQIPPVTTATPTTSSVSQIPPVTTGTPTTSSISQIPTVTTATTTTPSISLIPPVTTATSTISSVSQIPPVTTAIPTTSSISLIPPVTTATPTTSSVSQIPPVTTATSTTSSISQIPLVTTATPTTSSVSQIPPVTTATPTTSLISQIPPVTTEKPTTSSISQIPPVTTATPTTSSVSQIPLVTSATPTISSISQKPPVTSATPTISSISQIPPVTTATPTISSISQIPPVTTVTTDTTSSISQIPPVTTATPTTSSISQIPPVTTATPTFSSISQIPPVTTATPTISSITQIPPVTTATPTISSITQIPPVTTATPTISSISQIPPVTSATPTISSISQIPPVTTATPTISSISQIPPVTTVTTDTTSSISQIPPVTTATPTTSSISQIPPVTTATPTSSSISQIPPVTTATPTISSITQIPPVTTATPTTSSITQIPPVTTATPTTSAISQILPVSTVTTETMSSSSQKPPVTTATISTNQQSTSPTSVQGPDEVVTTAKIFPGMLSYGSTSGDQALLFYSDDDIVGPLRSSIGFACDCDWYFDIYVSVDGFILLGEAWNFAPPTPSNLDDLQPPAGTRVIAPFWTDMRFAANQSNIWFNKYYKYLPGGGEVIPSSLEEVFQNVSNSQSELVQAVKVTWENMAPVDAPNGTSEGVTFQLLLLTDSVHTYTVFNFGENSWDSSLNNVRPAAMTWYKADSYSLLSRTAEIYTEAFDNGNTGIPGRWAFQLDCCEYNYENEEHNCFLWSYTEEQDPALAGLPFVLDEALTFCPCSLIQMNQDDRFNKTEIPNCYGTLFSPYDDIGYRKCCYDTETNALYTSLPQAGYLSVYNPVDQAQLHELEDVQPYRSCCERSDLCALFINRRPVDDCQSYDVPDPSSTYGDPHISTVDGKNFTYNGIGEFVLLKIHNSSGNEIFELQGRLIQDQTVDEVPLKATVFSAFAAKERGAYCHVETNLNKDGFIIFSNTSETVVDSTNFYKQRKDISFDDVVIRYIRDTSVIVTFKSGISATVFLVNKFLDIRLQFPVEMRLGNRASGLLGNLDRDPTNEFNLPSGTILSNDITEQEIYQYAENWRVTATGSLLKYRVGRFHAEYQDPGFVPLYKSDFSPAQQTLAEQFCETEENFGCVYDFLVTADINIANDTLSFERRSKRLQEVAENNHPEITSLERQIFVELNQPYEIVIEATDVDDDMITLYLEGFTPQPLKSTGRGTTTLTYTWIKKDTSPVNASVYAVDSKGVSSIRSDPELFVCPGCNNGFCDYDSVVEDLTGPQRFTVVHCKCDIGWIGDDCLIDRDGCLGSPCFEGSVCRDVSPAVEQSRRIAFQCICLTGYQNIPGHDRCQDVNECTSGTSDCDQVCENVLGSYVCSCDSGYRMAGETCIDVNECLYGTSSCQHICTNTVGGYQCSCHPGYSLHPNEHTCDTSEEHEKLCRESGCDHGCVDEGAGIVRCFCDIGYILEGNNCIDKNECEDIHECAQICTNTIGGFECGCYTGFQISNDNLTCTECGVGRWGDNCQNSCTSCPFLDTCDPVHGCICIPGWEGALCDVDIDECTVDPDICGDPWRSCINTLGSYVCNCNAGFEETVDGRCQDIDECLAERGDDCPVGTSICVNKVPGFLCQCAQGYKGDGYNCINIDECALNLARCEHYCEDRVGYYNCDCYDGYVLRDDRKTCMMVRDPCANTSLSTDICLEQGSQGCRLIDGEPKCFCNLGYNMTSLGKCIDIDECLFEPCDLACTNLPGGYVCGCTPGSSVAADQLSCQACNLTSSWGPDCSNQCNCGTGALYCDSLIGCVCKTGWTGAICDTDINECLMTPCFANQICTNTPGSFTCSCNSGFEVVDSCHDIDDCQHDLCNQRCDNTMGSYMCLCWSGYEMAVGSNQTCVNVDECALGSHECQQICVDVQGSHYCTCHPGFNLQPDLLTCVRDHSQQPCYGLSYRCEYGCIEVDGKPVCHCPYGYILDPRDNSSCQVVYKTIHACMNLNLKYSDVFNIHGSSVFKAVISDIRVAVEHTVVFGNKNNITYDDVLDMAAILDVYCHSNKGIMVGTSLTEFIWEPMIIVPGSGKKTPITCLLCAEDRLCVMLDPHNGWHTCITPRDYSSTVDLEFTIRTNFIPLYMDRLSIEYATLASSISRALSNLFFTVDEFAGLDDIYLSPVSGSFDRTNVKMYVKFNYTVQPGDLAGLGRQLQALQLGQCLILDDQCVFIIGEIYLHRLPAVCWTCSPYEICLDNSDRSGFACVNRPDDSATGNSDLILGLGLGLPLVLFVVFICVVIYCVCARRQRPHSRVSDDSSFCGSFLNSYQYNVSDSFNYEENQNLPGVAIVASKAPELDRVPVAQIERQEENSTLVPILQHGAASISPRIHNTQSDAKSILPRFHKTDALSDNSSISEPNSPDTHYFFYRHMGPDCNFRIKRPTVSPKPAEIYRKNKAEADQTEAKGQIVDI